MRPSHDAMIRAHITRNPGRPAPEIQKDLWVTHGVFVNEQRIVREIAAIHGAEARP